jgi:hypothetical protein
MLGLTTSSGTRGSLTRQEALYAAGRQMPPCSRVATASQDGTVRLWDAKAERDPVVLKGHEGAVTYVNARRADAAARPA